MSKKEKSIKDKVKGALIGGITLFMLSIFLDDSTRLFIKYLLKYLIINLYFPILFLMISIFALSAYILLLKKWSFISKKPYISITMMIFFLTLCTVFIVRNRTIYDKKRDELNIYFAGFYKINDNGSLQKDPNGEILKRNIFTQIQSDIHKRGAFKLAPINIKNLTISDFILFTSKAENFTNVLKKKYPNRIIIWGIIDRLGTLNSFKFEYPETQFCNPEILEFFEQNIAKVSNVKLLTSNDLSEYISYTLLGLIQEIAKDYFVTITEDYGLALGLVDVAEEYFNEAIFILKRNNKAIYSPMINEMEQSILPLLTLHKASILLDEGHFNRAIENIYLILKQNLYFPYKNRSEFDNHYYNVYGIKVLNSAIEFRKVMIDYSEDINEELNYEMEELKRQIMRFNVFKKVYPAPALHYLQVAILDSPNYFEDIKIFEKLYELYPTNTILLIYWADTIKYYKSELFRPNYLRLDDAIEKYIEALALEKNNPIIHFKLSASYIFKAVDENKKSKRQGEIYEEMFMDHLGKAVKLLPSTLEKFFTLQRK